MADNTKRPFDLKAALSGAPVMIDGYSPKDERFLVKEYETPIDSEQKLVLGVLSETGKHRWITLDGVTSLGEQVYMAPRKVKKTVYVNLQHDNSIWWKYESERSARAAALPDDCRYLAVAVPVEIEVQEQSNG